MQRHRVSPADFDAFVVPTVPVLKQQRQTMATLIELNRIGMSASRLKRVFNLVGGGNSVARAFHPLLPLSKQQPIVHTKPKCRLGGDEIHGRIKGTKTDLARRPIWAADKRYGVLQDA